MSPTARWTLQRIALLDSPLLMIAAIASLFTDRPLLGIALALLSFGLYMLGRPTIGHRRPPGDERTLPAPDAADRAADPPPLPARRRRRDPRF